MTPTETKYIEKLKEYNLWLKEWLLYYIQTDKLYERTKKLESEISALKQKMKKEKTIFDHFVPDHDYQ